jgi:hypothetical protein
MRDDARDPLAVDPHLPTMAQRRALLIARSQHAGLLFSKLERRLQGVAGYAEGW